MIPTKAEVEPRSEIREIVYSPPSDRILPKHLRFLIAYENSDVRRTIRSILTEMGFSHIEERREHEDFSRTLKAEKIHCLICGPRALEWRDMKLLRSIRQDEDLRSLLVVGVISGDPQDKTVEIPPPVVREYISAPFSNRYFEKRIRRILGETF